MANITDKLKGGDLRSIGKVDSVVKVIQNQKDFDTLFKGLFDGDRLVVMRTADAVEKLTLAKPEYLAKHKASLIKQLQSAEHKELKWHLAQLIARVKLNEDEAGIAWNILSAWALDKKESRIVRVLSMQTLYDMLKHYPELKADFEHIVAIMEKEPIPSIAARIRILKKKGF